MVEKALAAHYKQVICIMEIEFPVIQSSTKYFIGGISEKEFQIAGELNMEDKWYEGVRYIDSVGQDYI